MNVLSYIENYGLPERPIVMNSPTGLHYCDTGELIKLLSTLCNQDCTRLHIKINEYFGRTIGGVSFIIENTDTPEDSVKIRAIGRVPLEDPLTFSNNCLLIRKVFEDKGMCRLSRNELEGTLFCEIKRILQEEYNQPFSNCFFYPIEHYRNGKRRPYIVALVNVKEFINYENVYIGIITECMRHCFGMIHNASNYEEEKSHHDKCKSVLTVFTQIISSIGTNRIYDEINKQSVNLLDGSISSLYLKNSRSELLFKARHSLEKDIFQGGEVTLLNKLVGETGKALNCTNPWDDPLYDICEKDRVPRNLLSYPVCHGDAILGVVEVSNKTNPQQGFNRIDMELAVPLSNITGIAISYHDSFQEFIKNRQKLAYFDCIFLRRIKSSSEVCCLLDVMPSLDGLIVKLVSQMWDTVDQVQDITYQEVWLKVAWSEFICLIPWLQNPSAVGILTSKLSASSNKYFKIFRFLLNVKHGYANLPFHNWIQALSTFHFTFVCINNLGLTKNKFITSMEAFVMLIAALCHCIDSRGSTSMFQMVSGTVLSSLFSSPRSVSQYHHASQTLRLMNFSECNFLENLSDDQYWIFADLLIHFIRDMDISHNLKKLSLLRELDCNEYDFNNFRHRRLIHNLILNVAQMSSCCKPWSFCRMVGENLFNEFFRKGDLSYATGVFEISELNEDILKLPDLNVNFFEKMSLPTFRVFSVIFPCTSLCVKKAEQNLKLWKAEKEKILANMVQSALADDESGDEK